MYVSHIKVRNWRNFKKAEARLARRVFLLGPNASGKSNLLDVFRFLADLARDGLRRAVEQRGGIASLRCLSARSVSDVTIEVTLADESDALAWQYRIVMNRDPARHTPRIKEERVVQFVDGVAHMLLARPDEQDEQDPLRLSQTSLEQIIANRLFRPIADLFKSISYLHLVPQIVRDPRGFSATPVENDPYGRDFLQRIWSTKIPTRNARLRLISDVLQQAIPQLEGLEVEQDSRDGTPHLIGKYEHWRPNAARHNEAQFSDGTLRLVGLLWALLDGDGPLLLEEPELSLHAEIVRLIPVLIERLRAQAAQRWRKPMSRRQILISTHSRELTSDEGIAAEEVLLLQPGGEGTGLTTPNEEDRRLIEAGLSIADVVLSRTRPFVFGQLSLFDAS